MDWPSVWYLPAIMAAIVLVIFLFTFREPEATGEKSDADEKIA